MAKIAIVYWSGTGNTEEMAEAVAAGAKEGGAEASLITAADFDVSQLESYDGFAFGCPAMGDEELEDSEFAPMFESVEGKLGDKPVVLFGSYSWAEGEWMSKWTDKCREEGINLVADSVISYEAPGAEETEKCKEIGKALIK